MGNQKQKWTADEEDALLRGIEKHGPGKWKNILRDPDFAPYLTHRSNIDLKDKWRNLSVSNAAQGSKDKSRAPKVKAVTVSLPTPSSKSSAQNSTPADRSADTFMDDSLNSALDGKNGQRYNEMIFEAISNIKDANECDLSAIVYFIEQRYEVRPNVRRLLGSRLRRLVSQGKLEKVQSSYRIKKDVLLGTKTPNPKQRDLKPGQVQKSDLTYFESAEEASVAAAYQVAEAENKSFLAGEAVKEAERVSKMAEDADSMLQLVKEIYEQCSRGEIVLLA